MVSREVQHPHDTILGAEACLLTELTFVVGAGVTWDRIEGTYRGTKRIGGAAIEIFLPPIHAKPTPRVLRQLYQVVLSRYGIVDIKPRVTRIVVASHAPRWEVSFHHRVR